MAFWINYALQHTHHGWRISIGLQAAPAVLLLLATSVMPYSPRWLVKRGRLREAETTLQRLRPAGVVAAELHEMKTSVQEEELMATADWSNILRGEGLRRLAIGCFLQTSQQLTGINAVIVRLNFTPPLSLSLFPANPPPSPFP